MRLMRWIVAASLILVSSQSGAASFDCTKASKPTERQICASPNISALDSQLATTYRAALLAADDQSKHDLQIEQRHWISYVRDICADDACLASSYEDRIKLLAQNQRTIINESNCEIPQGKSCRSVVTYRDTSARITSFNQSLKANGIGGSVIGCNKLIDLPVGFRDSNHSFGAYCTLQSGEGRKAVKVCNDDMLGRFAIAPVSAGTDAELRDFTNDRCYGG